MNILIVEDEITAAEKLIEMIAQFEPDAEFTICQSVKETVSILEHKSNFNIGFFDIQLADDISFEIFKKAKVEFPIIFTTAFDQYVLKALEENAIDYLLKPIQSERLETAIQKVKTLKSHFLNQNIPEDLHRASSKSRFLVKKGAEFVSVKKEDIAYFFTEHKVSFLVDVQGIRYIVDKPLADLYEDLASNDFFRINRKYISHIDSIEKFRSENGKIRVFLNPKTNDEVIVSKETAPKFRAWIEGN